MLVSFLQLLKWNLSRYTQISITLTASFRPLCFYMGLGRGKWNSVKDKVWQRQHRGGYTILNTNFFHNLSCKNVTAKAGKTNAQNEALTRNSRPIKFIWDKFVRIYGYESFLRRIRYSKEEIEKIQSISYTCTQ